MLLKLWEVLLLNRNDTIIPYNQYWPWLKSDVTDATQWDVDPWFVIFYFSYKLNPSWPQEYVVKFNSDKTNYQQKQPFFPLIVWVPFLFSFYFLFGVEEGETSERSGDKHSLGTSLNRRSYEFETTILCLKSNTIMARQEACDPWSRLTKLSFAQMSYHLIGEVRTLFLLVVQRQQFSI